MTGSTLKNAAKELGYEPTNYVTALTSRELGGDRTIFGDVFFLNETNKTIFHFYDDRGLDIVAEQRETIKGLFDRFNKWVLDYDRPVMNKVFS